MDEENFDNMTPEALLCQFADTAKRIARRMSELENTTPDTTLHTLLQRHLGDDVRLYDKYAKALLTRMVDKP